MGEAMRGDETISTYEQGVRIRKLIAAAGVVDARQVEQLVLYARRHPVEGIDEVDIRRYAGDILAGRWPNPPGYPENELRERFAKLARKAAVAKVGKRKAADPFASKLYGSPALPPDMEWPRTDDGRPMIFLAQFNLGRIRVVPLDTLEDTAMLSVFVADVDRMNVWEDEPKVFAFPSTDGLVAREVPEGIDLFKEMALTFRIVDDYPELDDPVLPLPEGLDPEQAWQTNVPDVLDDFPHNNTTKIGGYPNTIQTNYALWYARDVIRAGINPFVLQISTADADMDVGDFGVLYVGRFPEGMIPAELNGNPWIIEFQMF